MEIKPVIILGGGVMSNLLAYRLSQCLPHVPFKVLSASGSFEENCSFSFRETEISPPAKSWLEPIVSYKWSHHSVLMDEHRRTFKGPISVVLPGQLSQLFRRSHTIERLPEGSALEKLLDEASFIIDTRPDPRQKTKCYRHTVGIVVELREEHRLSQPVTMNTMVRQMGIFRHLQYFPMGEHTLLVKDIRYTKEPGFDQTAREEELLWEVRKQWRIKDAIHHEHESVMIPSGKLRPWNYGRVISLAGLINPVTADRFAEAVRLVDRMVETSFRLGELKQVIQDYRQEREREKRLSRLLVKLIYHTPEAEKRLQLMEYLFKLPAPAVERFLGGNLGVVDLSRAMLMSPPFPLMAALRGMTNQWSAHGELTAREL